MNIRYACVTAILIACCCHWALGAADERPNPAGTYLDRLKPVVQLRLDKAAGYRVLLYPYKKGDPQPNISGGPERIKITIGNQVRSVTFKKDKDNRTRLKAENN